jgi:hypothetical protein
LKLTDCAYGSNPPYGLRAPIKGAMMAISEEVRQIIFILEEEGFGALAGELLTEISLGHEVEKAIPQDDHAGGSDIETLIIRVPIEESDQLREAMNFIRMRLVLPVRAFAEAEQIAGRFSDKGGVRIRFVDPDERIEAEPFSRRDIGDASVADQLDAFLERLPSMIVPPSVDGS